MLFGKVNAALRLISNQAKGGVIPLSPDVLSQLAGKHPSPAAIDPSALLPDDITVVNPILFAGLKGDSILTSSLRTQGGAGPSGGDANQ